jgi:hypothetical protein
MLVEITSDTKSDTKSGMLVEISSDTKSVPEGHNEAETRLTQKGHFSASNEVPHLEGKCPTTPPSKRYHL